MTSCGVSKGQPFAYSSLTPRSASAAMCRGSCWPVFKKWSTRVTVACFFLAGGIEYSERGGMLYNIFHKLKYVCYCVLGETSSTCIFLTYLSYVKGVLGKGIYGNNVDRG